MNIVTITINYELKGEVSREFDVILKPPKKVCPSVKAGLYLNLSEI